AECDLDEHIEFPRCQRRPAVPADAGARQRIGESAQPLLQTGGPPLTPRELDVLVQVALGCTNVEAGQRLSLKPETVKSYLRS
ncbi:helix-turn-helix transcriptional regulator, partial [Mycobacterium sp. ITM-2017-0098]